MLGRFVAAVRCIAQTREELSCGIILPAREPISMQMDGPVVVREETSEEEDDTASEDGEANDSTDSEKSLEDIIDSYSD